MSWGGNQTSNDIRRQRSHARPSHSVSATNNWPDYSDALENDFRRRHRWQKQRALNPFSGEHDKRNGSLRQ